MAKQKISYRFMSPETVAMTANILGGASAAAAALEDWRNRQASGQLPVFLQAVGNNRSGTILVFDLSAPPDFLPGPIRRECAEVLAEIRSRADAPLAADTHDGAPAP